MRIIRHTLFLAASASCVKVQHTGWCVFGTQTLIDSQGFDVLDVFPRSAQTQASHATGSVMPSLSGHFSGSNGFPFL